LTARLNKNTGGIEKKVSDILPVESNDRYSLRDTLNITSSSKRGQKIDLSEAKIERDPETGKILRVIDEKLPKANPLNDPLNELESDSEDDTGIFSLRNQHDAVVKKPSSAHSTAVTDTVKQLEAEASRPVTKYKRKQPDGEREFIEDLVRKYGDDIGKMAQDTKINYMQRSEGDLKKRIKRWRENGGSIE
jgi:nucleolar protein 16